MTIKWFKSPYSCVIFPLTQLQVANKHTHKKILFLNLFLFLLQQDDNDYGFRPGPRWGGSRGQPAQPIQPQRHNHSRCRVVLGRDQQRRGNTVTKLRRIGVPTVTIQRGQHSSLEAHGLSVPGDHGSNPSGGEKFCFHFWVVISSLFLP